MKEVDEKTGKLKTFATPPFLALIMVEIANLIFAVDSITAITTDPFIVYTSNIFAILGLRALYFALAALIHRFAYLKYTLAAVLVSVGSKIFVADMLGHLGANERKLVFEEGKPDRRLYETATFAHLQDRLHSRDVWVEGSRSFRPIDEDLMPKLPFVALKGQDQLGLGVPSDCTTWLTDVRQGWTSTSNGWPGAPVSGSSMASGWKTAR